MAQTIKRSPVAWALGLAGLIPFIATAAMLWAGPPTLRGAALLALLAYAAVILSFLGGVRWGVEIARPEGPRPLPLLLSVLTALAGWVLLIGNLKVSPANQVAGYIVCFAIVGLWDRRSSTLPAGYRQLRSVLTVVVCAALLAAYFAARQLG